ncbi:hypothetical protein [Chromohalobacter sp. 11-W]|uniref:hypothetical protein n=1 Tax=Chromohalobacter sp. 11-W TaxID=2994061 RepID=UPI002469C5A4|nr:hypothetical protein [Chromohalobacter sp. 11-W]
MNDVIDALRRNDRRVHVWLNKKNDWGDGIPTSLLAIFETIAPDLLDEASYPTIASTLALHYAGDGYRKRWPVPTNFLRYYIADLASLDLVTNSSKRHSVQDTEAYWMLTDFGREVHGKIRQNELLHGATDFNEEPEIDGQDPECELHPESWTPNPTFGVFL